LRLQIKPFVRLIWLGALFVALGGTVAAMDKRYRRKRRSEKAGLEELVVNG